MHYMHEHRHHFQARRGECHEDHPLSGHGRARRGRMRDSDSENHHPHAMAGEGRHGRHVGHRGRHSFGGGRWGGDHRGRRRRVIDSGELRLVLLALIAEQPRHGYELIRAIEELTGGSYVPSPGMIYPTLTLLQDMGQIEEAKSDGARKLFQITAEGTAHLAQRKDEVDALLARLAALAAAERRGEAAPVRRAMENLRTALAYRLDREELRSDTLHEIAAILDEAARKIERL